MNIDSVKRILVVGSGTMGQEIGLQCALHGYEVVLYDLDPTALTTAESRMAEYLAYRVKKRHFDNDAATTTRNRLTFESDAARAAQNVDLLSESVPEDPVLKGQVFAQFNNICPPRTIFTTNTSSLIPSMFAEATGRPQLFAALHFHLPVYSSNVVDIMPHKGTSPETVALLESFAQRIGQIPIVLQQEHHGYVFNSMLNAVLDSAITLAANGITSFESVDRAWMGVMKMPIGPFGIIDQIGLDTVWKISDYWATTTNEMQLRKNADFIKTFLDDGHRGKKNGRGFYIYPNPLFEEEGFLVA
jgi:3-hydroxybutyryl-CoA dehydrogenase